MYLSYFEYCKELNYNKFAIFKLTHACWAVILQSIMCRSYSYSIWYGIHHAIGYLILRLLTITTRFYKPYFIQHKITLNPNLKLLGWFISVHWYRLDSQLLKILNYGHRCTKYYLDYIWTGIDIGAARVFLWTRRQQQFCFQIWM